MLCVWVESPTARSPGFVCGNLVDLPGDGQGISVLFSLPWGAVLLSCVGVFMVHAMHKLQAEDPVDALKNENL